MAHVIVHMVVARRLTSKNSGRSTPAHWTTPQRRGASGHIWMAGVAGSAMDTHVRRSTMKGKTPGDTCIK